MPRIELHSSAGRLAGLHDLPESDAPAVGPRAAVVCHPHPLGGGTMQNKVVHAVARALAKRGLHVVRFNFRGCGGSEGVHDEGRSEADDVRAALQCAAELVPGAGPGSLALVGYSFGAWVGGRVALEDARVAGVMLIAPPVNFYDFADLAASRLPTVVVYAEDDEIVPPDRTLAWLASFRDPPLVRAVAGAGHLFHAKLDGVRRAADAFLDGLCRMPAS